MLRTIRFHLDEHGPGAIAEGLDGVHTMRTNVVIDDELMSETLRVTGLKTEREAVELGLRTLLRLNKQAEIRLLRGKLRWDGDLEAMRCDEDSSSIRVRREHGG